MVGLQVSRGAHRCYEGYIPLDIIPAFPITLTLLGAPAACPVEHFATSSGISLIPCRTWRSALANVLVRDLDDEVLRQLKAAAKTNGRSLHAEIHDILRRASTRNLAETRRLSSLWMKRLRRSIQSDSTALIREDREDR